MREKKYFWHIVAIIIVAIWGITYVSTKVLIENGLMPQEIFVLRFLMAYVGIWFISHKRLWADNWKDELWFILAGITGGSVYFLTENTALGITLASNVSFIVCSAPLYTALFTLMLDKNEKATVGLIGGSLMALVGMALVIYNGSFILKLSPLGDFLSLLAALSWASYSIIIRRFSHRYGTAFISRKVFFYGLLTVLPAFLVHPWQADLSVLLQPTALGNLLFLGIIASLGCYVVWNIVLKQLGTIRASNYIYLNPLFTLAGSIYLINEPLTWLALIGIVFIFVGVYWAGRRK